MYYKIHNNNKQMRKKSPHKKSIYSLFHTFAKEKKEKNKEDMYNALKVSLMLIDIFSFPLKKCIYVCYYDF